MNQAQPAQVQILCSHCSEKSGLPLEPVEPQVIYHRAHHQEFIPHLGTLVRALVDVHQVALPEGHFVVRLLAGDHIGVVRHRLLGDHARAIDIVVVRSLGRLLRCCRDGQRKAENQIANLWAHLHNSPSYRSGPAQQAFARSRVGPSFGTLANALGSVKQKGRARFTVWVLRGRSPAFDSRWVTHGRITLWAPPHLRGDRRSHS